MLVTGVFWGTWFALTRSIETFSPREFIHIGRTIIANVATPMKIIMPLCILFMLLAVWVYLQKKPWGYYFNLTAFTLIIITLLITLIVLVPIDNQIKLWNPNGIVGAVPQTNPLASQIITWTADAIPANWEAIRARWQFFHTFRTLTSLGSFACFSVAVLKSK